MESSTRNLMVLYAAVAMLATVGFILNIIQTFNLKSIEDAEVTEEVVELFTKGFYIIALFYLIIAVTSLGAIIKRRFSKLLLLVLTILLIATFVFGPLIFDFILGDNALEINAK